MARKSQIELAIQNLRDKRDAIDQKAADDRAVLDLSIAQLEAQVRAKVQKPRNVTGADRPAKASA